MDFQMTIVANREKRIKWIKTAPRRYLERTSLSCHFSERGGGAGACIP
jgi:hypothetical protein